MLHTETVELGTLAVLMQLMAMPAMTDFSLVGGTALSLRYGHRLSIDLDLFTDVPFENMAVIRTLESEFGPRFSYRNTNSGLGVFGFIDGVKVDIIRYPHPRIAEIVTEHGIRMYSDADMAAIIIPVTLGRSTQHDFWDMHEMLQHHGLKQFLDWYGQKYPDQMMMEGMPQALLCLEDADDRDAPVSLKGQTWDGVKDAIRATVRDSLS